MGQYQNVIMNSQKHARLPYCPLYEFRTNNKNKQNTEKKQNIQTKQQQQKKQKQK